jgi:hypothetical protein
LIGVKPTEGTWADAASTTAQMNRAAWPARFFRVEWVSLRSWLMTNPSNEMMADKLGEMADLHEVQHEDGYRIAAVGSHQPVKIRTNHG